MIVEIVSIIGCALFAIDSLMFIALLGKISILTENITELTDFFTSEEEEDEETKKIREHISKTMFS